MICIIEYEKRYHSDFKRLNLEWLEKYNLTEDHDLAILDDPEGKIIAEGGAIFLAMDTESSTIAGTAGIAKETEKEYELVKMAVDPAYRGKGISKLLLDKCLQAARQKGAEKMVLFSNSQLKAALKLYEQYGFSYVDVTNSPMLTADIKMELDL